ncbi:MAG: hypothetical protein U0893_27365 [Chloroflexota bacterium]
MAAKAGVMVWQDVMIDRWIEHDALRAAFALVFAIDPARIEIVDLPDTLTGPIPPEPYILLERIDHEGPFPLHLRMVLAGDTLECPVADLAGTLDYVRALARALNATMLFWDGPIGHDEELRVAPDGTVDIVEMDDDELDEERYVIVGSRPFTELPASATTAAAG